MSTLECIHAFSSGLINVSLVEAKATDQICPKMTNRNSPVKISEGTSSLLVLTSLGYVSNVLAIEIEYVDA